MDPSELRRDRGRRLSEARHRANLSAEELVRKVALATHGRRQISPSAVYGWEKGRNLLREKVAKDLAPVLGCSVEDLTGPTVERPKGLSKVPLGGQGAVASESRVESSEERRPENELILEASLRMPGRKEPLRKRVWKLDFEREKGRIVVRAGEGAAPEFLHLLQPQNEGVGELSGRRDFRDLSAVNVAFDYEDLPEDPDECVLFLQLDELALGLTRADIDEASPPDTEIRPTEPAEVSVSKDIEYEVADFLGQRMAQRACAFWEEGKEHLEYFRSRLSQEFPDAYTQRLAEAVIFTSLLKDHEQARRSIDELWRMVSDDDRQVADVAYLSGRNWWYLGKEWNGETRFPQAIEELILAWRMAESAGHRVRVAQCFIFLSRITYEAPVYEPDVRGKTGYGPAELLDAAKQIGIELGRADIEILADRAEFDRLRQERGPEEEAIDVGRRLLGRLEEEAEKGRDFRNIYDNTAILAGIALRHSGTEDARKEAEDIYRKGLSRGRNDSHGGICAYLIGDLYADRAIEAVPNAAAIQDSRSPEFDQKQAEAEQHLRTARKWYDSAVEMLKDRGDRKALEKALYRQAWVRHGKLPAAQSQHEVLHSHATRQREITQRLIGEHPAKQTKAIEKVLLQEILSTRHLATDEVDSVQAQRDFRVEDYFDTQTLLLIPRRVGSSFMVQGFLQSKDGSDQLSLQGWAYLRDFVGNLRRQLNRLQAECQRVSPSSWEIIEDLADEIQIAFLNHLEWIRPFELRDKRSWRRIAVLAPDDFLESLLPFESLVYAQDDQPLLRHCEEAALYAGPWGAPLKSARVVVPSDDLIVFADDVELAWEDRRRRRERLDRIVAGEVPLSVQPLPKEGAEIRETGVVVVAHSDAEGNLRERIRSWRFRDTRAILLMFCGSGSFDLLRGPFSDGLAQRIRRDLGDDGIVVCNRLPVSVAEAIQLLSAIIADDGPPRPLAHIVTDYMKQQAAEERNPFLYPWFVL